MIRVPVHDRNKSTGQGPPPPEWNGENPNFQDWLIKARLWLATTRTKPKSRPDDFTEALRTTVPVSEALGKGQDVALRREEWPEDFGPFGEDREEEFLAALAKLTYHLKRGRDEQCRPFFARWDGAVKKIQEPQFVSH